MASGRVRCFLIVLGSLFLSSACDKSESAWQAARQANRVDAYTEFLKTFPRSPHINEARESLELIAWKEAKSKGACREFIKTHPNSSLLKRARECAESEEDNERWQKASAENTRTALRNFIQAFPNSKFVGEANRRIEAMGVAEEREWQSVLSERKFETLQAFLQKYPDNGVVQSSTGAVKRAYATYKGGMRATVLYNPEWLPGHVAGGHNLSGWTGQFELVEQPGVVFTLEYPDALSDKIHLSGSVLHLKDEQGGKVTLDDRKMDWTKFTGRKVHVLWFREGKNKPEKRVIVSITTD